MHHHDNRNVRLLPDLNYCREKYVDYRRESLSLGMKVWEG
jgi:hypothetical protein